MGRESATYLFIPKHDDTFCIETSLSNLGITATASNCSTFRYYTYKGTRFWIDLQVGTLVDSVKNAISIRIALCNPREVEQAFEQLIEALLLNCGGRLIDRSDDTAYDGTNKDDWQPLLSSFRSQKATFVRFFGDFEAPISGDDVFKVLGQVRSTPNSDDT